MKVSGPMIPTSRGWSLAAAGEAAQSNHPDATLVALTFLVDAGRGLKGPGVVLTRKLQSGHVA